MSGAMEPYMVIGYWPETGERYADCFRATSPRAAEDQAALGALEKSTQLYVARVIQGQLACSDLYTLYTDRNDPRNEQADSLQPDVAGIGDPEWTVVGIAAPPGTASKAMPWTGERYMMTVSATSAGAAEDVVTDQLREKGTALTVCAVFEGRYTAADSYATFVGPDVQKEPEGQ